MNIDALLDGIDFELPEELIAKFPPEKRDGGRLLKVGAALEDLRIRDFINLLRPEDVLVLNDTRVMRARLRCRRSTGGAIEVFVLRVLSEGVARALLRPSRRVKQGEWLSVVGSTAELELCDYHGNGEWTINGPIEKVMADQGEMPIPPYFRRSATAQDVTRYQTVFAGPAGAVAAPTAGLHLTQEMLESFTQRGGSVAYLTLHVGAGTFRALTQEQIHQKRLHRERFVLGELAAETIRSAQSSGGRVIAVGTTSTRCLETIWRKHGEVRPDQAETDLFILPGDHFGVVDGLLTNFHLPRSSLLLLVSAFAGSERVRLAYQHAIKQRYRFFSYGDAMFLTNQNEV